MIAKIAGMRTFNKKDRMQADSLPEIRFGLDDIALQMGRKFKVGRRPASEGHFVNAAIVVLLGMTEEEREHALGRAFAKINALLAIDEPSEEDVARILGGEDQIRPREGGGFDLSKGGREDIIPVGDIFPHVKKKGRKKPEGA